MQCDGAVSPGSARSAVGVDETRGCDGYRVNEGWATMRERARARARARAERKSDDGNIEV